MTPRNIRWRATIHPAAEEDRIFGLREEDMSLRAVIWASARIFVLRGLEAVALGVLTGTVVFILHPHPPQEAIALILCLNFLLWWVKAR